ncbi:Interferon-induced guanylate-binding protein 1 [Myotis davidii]|uniref:Interferon-induced guanylate-binding protein 1 n=1 Tax=Myotis davidii TaxID=225400 RepID=L5LK02_MYODS|nr:Interferon-induced guanylate-binding protein 1 [Myotis davidii]
MASDIQMPGPVCLIENTNTQLVVNPEALKILSAITQPVVVVAIVGLYRTGKSYLMNKLAGQQKGTSSKDKNFNLPRLCIRKFFPEKKCFIFDRPTHRKKLGQLETMHDDELDPEFVQQAADFCSYIFSNSKVKTLSGGIQVNGPRLESLVMTYINAISSGDLPCMENAILALAQIENSAAVQKAIAHYDQQMAEKVELPTETLQELLDLHMASEKEAIEVFIKNSFKDVDHLFQKELAAHLEKRRDDFYKENIKASSDRCSALLKDIFQSLEEDIKQGAYSKSGGYRLLMQTVQELKKKYLQAPKKGIQSEEVLHAYLSSKQSVIDAILQTDQTLTEKEKEIEVQRVKAESAEAAAKMLEEMQKKNQQMMEEKERSYQEHVKQLTEKMEQERAQLMAEQEKVLALKLQRVQAARQSLPPAASLALRSGTAHQRSGLQGKACSQKPEQRVLPCALEPSISGSRLQGKACPQQRVLP